MFSFPAERISVLLKKWKELLSSLLGRRTYHCFLYPENLNKKTQISKVWYVFPCSGEDIAHSNLPYPLHYRGDPITLLRFESFYSSSLDTKSNDMFSFPAERITVLFIFSKELISSPLGRRTYLLFLSSYLRLLISIEWVGRYLGVNIVKITSNYLICFFDVWHILELFLPSLLSYPPTN